MGREVRRVPVNWKHPKAKGSNTYQPMYDQDFETASNEWKAQFKSWEDGTHEDFAEYGGKYEFWEWDGDPPNSEYYRPKWSDEERTHIQMYETTSEGTPISPVMETPEELAKWLYDNNAPAFAYDTASYEEWLAMCKQGWAISGVYDSEHGLRSGVAACGDTK